MDAFKALVLSLPTRNSTLRMRVWRALKESGCGVLRDGVYVLPASALNAKTLAKISADIRAAGGFAMAAELRPGSDAELAQVRRLFDRGANHGALVAKIKETRAEL